MHWNTHITYCTALKINTRWLSYSLISRSMHVYSFNILTRKLRTNSHFLFTFNFFKNSKQIFGLNFFKNSELIFGLNFFKNSKLIISEFHNFILKVQETGIFMLKSIVVYTLFNRKGRLV